VAAGVRLIMVGHCPVPAVTGRSDLPASLSGDIVRLARSDLGFHGVIITDALEMGSIAQGTGNVVDAIAALRAGSDLLLCSDDRDQHEAMRRGLALALSRGLIHESDLGRSRGRVQALRRWLAGFTDPGMDVVGCAEHRGSARELAERSVTLVRDEASCLPIRLEAGAPVATVMPRPHDLTPADTSATVAPGLAAAIRGRHGRVDEYVVPLRPAADEIAELRRRAPRYDLLVVGTIDACAHPEQAELVRALLTTGVSMVAVAMRTPSDLVAYPEAPTYVCTYGVLPPAMDALAAALWGAVPFRGRLPVMVSGLYPTGHGLTT